MQSGLLTGTMTRERVASLPANDFRRGSRFFQEPMFSKAQAIVERLRAVGEKHGRTPGEVAIAWTLRHPAITATIVGARKPAQIDQLIGAATFRLSPDEVRARRSARGRLSADPLRSCFRVFVVMSSWL